MARRKPQPWFHKQSGNWKVQIGRKQTNLGPNEEAAWDAYHKLMVAAPGATKDPTLYDVFNRYLAFCEAKREPSTFSKMQRHLKRAATHLGKRIRVSELVPEHMYEWVDRDYADSLPTYQNDAISAVIVAINYCRLPNPLHRMEKPTRQQREFYLMPEQWQLLVDAVSDKRFRDYCLFGLHTGARPQEIGRMEARHYEQENSRIVFPKQESKGKKRPRFVYLDEVAKEIVERNLRSDGPILLNQKGNGWNKDNTNCRFRRLKTKLKMPEIVAYTLRHSFAVWKLMEGVQVSIVGALMGHVDSRMVETRYGHIQSNKALMLAASQTSSPLAQPPQIAS